MEYEEAITRLNYLAKVKGFGILTGSPGRGKTTAIRTFAASLNPSLYKVVYSCLSTLTANDFFRNLAAKFGAQKAFRKPDNFWAIQEEITRLSVEKKKTLVKLPSFAEIWTSAVSCPAYTKVRQKIYG